MNSLLTFIELRTALPQGGMVIGSTSRLPCNDMPRIDMPRLGSTCRFHISICHIFHFHVTNIKIRNGPVTPRLRYPWHTHHKSWWHRYATYTISITHYTELAIHLVTIQVLSRDLPDNTRWIINRNITVIPPRWPLLPPVASPCLPVAPRRVKTTSISSLYKPCHTPYSWYREEGGSLLFSTILRPNNYALA
jgi:hypothetical protein